MGQDGVEAMSRGNREQNWYVLEPGLKQLRDQLTIKRNRKGQILRQRKALMGFLALKKMNSTEDSPRGGEEKQKKKRSSLTCTVEVLEHR